MPISSLTDLTKSHHQATDQNDQKQHQSFPKEVTVFD